jgi:hypothetical protein
VRKIFDYENIRIDMERRNLMKNAIIMWIFCAMFLIGLVPTTSVALAPSETLTAVADALVNAQYKDDQFPYFIGSWPGDYHYTGTIVAGLINAYDITKIEAYKEASELATVFILLSSEGNFYGDEAYALARLGVITGEPGYTNIVRNFYDMLDTHSYIRGFNETTTEKAAFYISFHAVASYMVGAEDAGIWREAIIHYLSQVGDDLSYFPVMTLGVTTWALVQTGPMDDTRIDPFGSTGVDYWKDVTLSDLPDLLSTHQVLSGEYAGSFYVRFDHTAPGSNYYESGYTGDTVYGLLGLIAANDANNVGTLNNEQSEQETNNVNWDFDEEIQIAREVLAKSVHQSGLVQEHIWDGYQIHYFYGAELLETFTKNGDEPE